MKPQTLTSELDDPLDEPSPAASQFAFFFVIRSRSMEHQRQITHRFGLEFNLHPTLQSVELPSPEGAHSVIGAFRDLLDGDRLPAIQQHADRVSKLFPAEAPGIRIGYASRKKVTLAFQSDAPGRIYLRGGIWAGILAERNADGAWEWVATPSDLRCSPELEVFFNAILPKSAN